MKAIVAFAKANRAKFVNFKGKANSFVAAQLDLEQIFAVNSHQVAYLALGDEELSQILLQKVEDTPFVVVQSSYHSSLTAKADVVLPVTNWLEQDGHFISGDGIVQEAFHSLQPSVDVRSNQQVLEDLAEKMNIIVDLDWMKSVLQSPATLQMPA